FFSGRRRHTRCSRDWSSDVCSSDLNIYLVCIFKGLADGTLASLPLHRFHSAKATWEDLEAPGGFEMNSFEVKRSLISQKTEHPRSEERRVGKERRTRWSEMEDSETA